jgi:hypothetical protein
MSVSQTQFRDAILDAAHPVPAGLVDGTGRPAGRRFSVYRNNVAVGLTEALAASFPVIEKLLGSQNFKGVIGIYLRQHLPPTPLIPNYGVDLAEFLADFPQLSHIGYLADVARLEFALRQSYNAADSTAIDPGSLQTLDPEALMAARFSLAPSLRLVQSVWPIHAIWRLNTEENAQKPPAVAQDVLIMRPEFDPAPHLLAPGAADFIIALQQGQTLGEAHAIATERVAGFDLSTVLGLLLSGQALTKLQQSERQT